MPVSLKGYYQPLISVSLLTGGVARRDPSGSSNRREQNENNAWQGYTVVAGRIQFQDRDGVFVCVCVCMCVCVCACVYVHVHVCVSGSTYMCMSPL